MEKNLQPERSYISTQFELDIAANFQGSSFFSNFVCWLSNKNERITAIKNVTVFFCAAQDIHTTILVRLFAYALRVFVQ